MSITSDGITAKYVVDRYLNRFRNLEGIGAIVELMPGATIEPQTFETEVKIYYDDVTEARDKPYKLYRLAHEVANGPLHSVDKSFTSALLVRVYNLFLDEKQYLMAWHCRNEAKRLGAKDITDPLTILSGAENNEKYVDAIVIALNMGDTRRAVINLRGYYNKIMADDEPNRTMVQTLMSLYKSITNKGYPPGYEPLSKKIRDLYAKTFPEKAG